MMLEGLRDFNSYGQGRRLDQLPLLTPNSPTPNSQARRTFGDLEGWGLGVGSWELKVAAFSARQTIPGAEDLAQKPLVFFVNLDTL